MKYRALLALSWMVSSGLPAATTGSPSLYGAMAAHEPGRPAPQSVFPRRQIIQFTQPPLQLEKPIVVPPPLVTFRSAPELRALYPPNPSASTVSEAFRQTFGNLMEFRFTLRGPDETLLTRRATAEALMSLAGRVYFLDRLILSLDLLPKYFEQNGDRFVRRVFPSNRMFEAGQPKFDLKVIIDESLLLADLEQKRFVYRPKLRPFFFIYLQQTVNGLPDSELERGRKAMEDVLRDRNLRYAEHGVPSMPNADVDILASEKTFLEGRRAAQRNEIEVVLTGSLTTRMTDLLAPLGEEDWADNTLAATVQSDAVTTPLAARLPLAALVAKLDQTLQARKTAGEREWWDVGSIEVDAPLESVLGLSPGQRAALERASLPLKALIPVERVGLKRDYYTPMYYASARLRLKLVRVDTQEVLGESYGETTAAHEDRAQAFQRAISQVVGRSSNELVDRFNRVWPKTVLDKANYKILVSRVSENDVENLADLLMQTDPRAEVYIRGMLGDVAVLTVVYPDSQKRLIDVLTMFEHPRFRLVSADKTSLSIEQI